MNWLVVFWALQLGYIPAGNVVVDSHWWEQTENATEATMEVTAVLFKHLELGGMLKSYQTPAGGGYFMPYRMDYGIHADLVMKSETTALRVGISHECDHSIALGFFNPPPVPLAMSQTEVYVRIESKIGW